MRDRCITSYSWTPNLKWQKLKQGNWKMNKNETPCLVFKKMIERKELTEDGEVGEFSCTILRYPTSSSLPFLQWRGFGLAFPWAGLCFYKNKSIKRGAFMCLLFIILFANPYISLYVYIYIKMDVEKLFPFKVELHNFSISLLKQRF